MILICITLGPLGNVFLGKGMKAVGHINYARISDIFPIACRVLTSPFVWVGIVCFLGFFVAHMLFLTWADYSYVQPANSLAYFFVALFSYLLLGEIITPLRWLGITVICLGVFWVGRTHPNTTGAHHSV